MRYRTLLSRRFRSMLLALCLACITAGAAAAHASMVRSDPPDFGLRGPQLAQVTAWFDLPLQAESSTITVLDAAGDQVNTGQGGVDPTDTGRQRMVAHLTAPLAAGPYTVRWHALSDEGLHTGHITDGQFSFWVSDQLGLLRPGWGPALLGCLGAAASLGIWIRYLRGRSALA